MWIGDPKRSSNCHITNKCQTGLCSCFYLYSQAVELAKSSMGDQLIKGKKKMFYQMLILVASMETIERILKALYQHTVDRKLLK